MTDWFEPGDIVLVLESYEDDAPKPGAVGIIMEQCVCARAVLAAITGIGVMYGVEFSKGRQFCYAHKWLRKLEPGEDVTAEHIDAVSV